MFSTLQKLPSYQFLNLSVHLLVPSLGRGSIQEFPTATSSTKKDIDSKEKELDTHCYHERVSGPHRVHSSHTSCSQGPRTIYVWLMIYNNTSVSGPILWGHLKLTECLSKLRTVTTVPGNFIPKSKEVEVEDGGVGLKIVRKSWDKGITPCTKNKETRDVWDERDSEKEETWVVCWWVGRVPPELLSHQSSQLFSFVCPKIRTGVMSGWFTRVHLSRFLLKDTESKE